MNFIQKKLELHTDEQTYSTKVPTFCTTSSTNKVRSETFDSLLDFNKRRMQIDKDKSKKVSMDIFNIKYHGTKLMK